MRPTVAITLGLALWAAVLIGLWAWAADTETETTDGQVEETRQARYTSAGWLPVDELAATPTSSPSPKRETPVHLAGPDGLEQLVAEAFPEDPETAMRIVSCESGWDPAARSRTGDTGLFQINDIHRAPGGVAEGLTIDDLSDPATNVAIARKLYDTQGWQPWACY